MEGVGGHTNSAPSDSAIVRRWMITNTERDMFVANCIAKGWTVKVLKPRPPLGKHKKEKLERNTRKV